jgi:NADH-quinone oxidoreductase subunit A
MGNDFWPFFLYLAASVVVLAGMLIFSFLLGQRHHEAATDDPYESGILPTGSARVRYDVLYYLVAMFFVVFDLEAVFIFLWAVALRRVGWTGYIDATVFIGVLVAGLAYLWRLGALDWGRLGRGGQRYDG